MINEHQVVREAGLIFSDLNFYEVIFDVCLQ